MPRHSPESGAVLVDSGGAKDEPEITTALIKKRVCLGILEIAGIQAVCNVVATVVTKSLRGTRSNTIIPTFLSHSVS